MTRILLLFLVLCLCASAATVYVQPIQVCDSAGFNCANPNRELYDAFTGVLWAQAGIRVEYLNWMTIRSSTFYDIARVGTVDLLWSLPVDITGASVTSNVISMWFVNSLPFDSAGVSTFPGNQIVISDRIFRYENPNYSGGAGQVQGRTDTIAHEIGHALGLDHCDPQCSGPFLMGENRVVPSSLNQIRQIGPLGTLAYDEVRIALQSPLVDQSREWELREVVLIPIGVELAGAVARNPGLRNGIATTVVEIEGLRPPGGTSTTTTTQTPGLPVFVVPSSAEVASISNAPEPGTMAMFAAGFALIFFGRAKRYRMT